MFVKSNGKIAIAKDADLYGSGLIIEQNRIVGKNAACDIIARKQDGLITNFVMKCATGVAIENVEFNLKFDSENKITRLNPSLPELSVSLLPLSSVTLEQYPKETTKVGSYFLPGI